MNAKHMIWTSQVDYEDWENDMEENYPDLTEEERIMLMYEFNNDELLNERSNLNIPMHMPIIAIGDIGRWYGRVKGYKMIPTGNIGDCLHSETDEVCWYVDEMGDLRADEVHHDGENFILYRAVRPGVSEQQIENLQDKILEETVTRRDITRLTTRLGDEIAKVYGWDLAKPHRSIIDEQKSEVRG